MVKNEEPKQVEEHKELVKNEEAIQSKETKPHAITNMHDVEQHVIESNMQYLVTLWPNPYMGKMDEEAKPSKTEKTKVQAEHSKAKKASRKFPILVNILLFLSLNI